MCIRAVCGFGLDFLRTHTSKLLWSKEIGLCVNYLGSTINMIRTNLYDRSRRKRIFNLTMSKICEYKLQKSLMFWVKNLVYISLVVLY